MKREAATADPYRSHDDSLYPGLQILTIEEIFAGKRPQHPAIQVNGAPRGVACFGAGALSQPSVKAEIDVAIRCGRIRTSEVLTHQRKARLEKIKRDYERIAGGNWTGMHLPIVGRHHQELDTLQL
jgi:hypothetical protein